MLEHYQRVDVPIKTAVANSANITMAVTGDNWCSFVTKPNRPVGLCVCVGSVATKVVWVIGFVYSVGVLEPLTIYDLSPGSTA